MNTIKGGAEQSNELNWQDWTIFGVLCIVWGTSFILIKKGLIAFDHYDVAVIRISVTMLAFTPFFIKYLYHIDWSRFWKFLLIGLTGSGIPAFLYPLAQTQISSSVAGILNSLTPIFTLIIGIVIFKVSFQGSKMVGSVIGFIGACMLILSGENTLVSGNNWYAIYIILGTICYGFSVNAVKEYFQDTNSILISAVSFGLIGPPALIYIIFFSDIPHIMMNEEHGMMSFIYIALLAIFSTVFGTVYFFKLIQRTNAIFGASISYLIPVVALFWGLVDGELINIFHILSMFLILFGVYLVRGRQR